MELADHCRDLVLLDQPLGDGGAHVGLVLRVVEDEPDLLAEHATLGVEIGHGLLQRPLHLLTTGDVPGLGEWRDAADQDVGEGRDGCTPDQARHEDQREGTTPAASAMRSSFHQTARGPAQPVNHRCPSLLASALGLLVHPHSGG